jgi:hypothetical protein
MRKKNIVPFQRLRGPIIGPFLREFWRVILHFVFATMSLHNGKAGVAYAMAGLLVFNFLASASNADPCIVISFDPGDAAVSNAATLRVCDF